MLTQWKAYGSSRSGCLCYLSSRHDGVGVQANRVVHLKDRLWQNFYHAALISTLVLSPCGASAATPHEVFQASSDDGAGLNCPDYTGLRKNICYGPCCGIPWGPGGPICLALSAGAFRSGMPYRFSSWVRSPAGEDDDVGSVDVPALLFSAALFLGSAPLTFSGVAFSWLFLVVCLV
jgi:hypothetical protein